MWCVSAFGMSYLIDRGASYGPDAQQTTWLQGLNAAEVVVQGKKGLMGAGWEGSDASEVVL